VRGTFYPIPIEPGDARIVADLARTHWHSSKVVSRGVVHDVSGLPGFKVVDGGIWHGMVTFSPGPGPDELEVVSLDSFHEGAGVGSALISRMKEEMVARGSERLWLITTNENVRALNFYLKRGFRLVAIHLDALVESRRLKPEIPTVDEAGIAIRDEWELEWRREG